MPKFLKSWFILHFVVDYIFGIPLLVAPVWFLTMFEFTSTDPLTGRLVGAALLGIGGESLLMRNAGLNTYKEMLNLKIIWSLSAILGIGISIVQGAPPITYIILGIFSLFSTTWIFYRLKI
jgi:hypothetical protein